jgi:choline dehydrogenase
VRNSIGREEGSRLTHFDSVIVGCGTAGAILAARLSEDSSRSVCVVEAGAAYASVDAMPAGVRSHRSARGLTSRNDPDVLGFPDWGLRACSTRLQPDVHIPRGRVIGGSSSVNGGVFFRALRDDLDEWVADGLPLWAYTECLPYFNRLETDFDFGQAGYHGDRGPIPVHRAQAEDWVPLNKAFHAACLELGFPECADFNEPDMWGVGPLPVNIHDSVRVSSAIGYLLPARDRPNLTILAGATARRLVIDRGRATAVEIDMDGAVSSIEGTEIILAAGAIGSPQLLLLSGVGPAEHLRSVGVDVLVDLPGVGQNLRDHPVLCASWAAADLELPTAPPGTPGQLGLRATTPRSTDTQDMRLVSFRAEGPNRFGIPFSLMHASSRGFVELADAQPVIPPCIDFRHLEEPSDLQRMRDMLAVVTEILHQPAYDGLRLHQLEPLVSTTPHDLDDWMLRTVITGHHASATCRMGTPENRKAVVDQTGRVYGVDNLRIVDASIMPDCPRVNINATTMMLAERIADVIRGSLQPSATRPTAESTSTVVPSGAG